MKNTLARLKGQQKTQWVLWPLWLIICFLVAGYVGGALVVLIARTFGFAGALNTTLGLLIFQVLIYAMLLGLIFSMPQVRKLTNRKQMGVQRPLGWGDIGLGVAGYIVYLIGLLAVMTVLTQLIPQFNASQAQDLGFEALYGIDRYIALIVFVVIAPVVEELIMRGFLYGKLRQAAMPKWPAALLVSVLFGLAHGQWNVGVDTFLLSMVACYLREATGTIWPGVVIHMLKNLLAYIMLFVVMPL